MNGANHGRSIAFTQKDQRKQRKNHSFFFLSFRQWRILCQIDQRMHLPNPADGLAADAEIHVAAAAAEPLAVVRPRHVRLLPLHQARHALLRLRREHVLLLLHSTPAAAAAAGDTTSHHGGGAMDGSTARKARPPSAGERNRSSAAATGGQARRRRCRALRSAGGGDGASSPWC